MSLTELYGLVSKDEKWGLGTREWEYLESTVPEFLVEAPSEVVVVPPEVQQYLPTIHIATKGVPRTVNVSPPNIPKTPCRLTSAI